jgi:hypothetical protein
VDGIARRDRIRLGVGAGWAFYGAGPVDGPLAFGELHLPRLPAPGWELVANGGVLVTWPHPSLMGGLAVDRAWGTGALQARTGLGFEASLLQAPGLLAPTLVPEARLAATWLPGWRGERFPLPLPSPFLSLGAQGGWLWYTNEGRFESSFSARLGLSGGGAF